MYDTIQQAIWATLLGVVTISIVMLFTQCDRENKQLRSQENMATIQGKAEALKTGVDPILVKCAFDGDIDSPACVAKIFNK